MKKILATILALVMALGLTATVWAEGDGTASGSMTGADFLAKAKDGVITLTDDVTLTSTLEITNGKNVTIDLNGNTLTAKDNLATAIKVSNGYLIVKNTAATNGKVVAKGEAFHLAGNNNPATWESTSTPAELVIEKGVEVESSADCSVYLYGKGAKVDVYGKLVSKGIYATIQGQGTINNERNNSGTEIVIHEGAEVIHTGAAGAIYHPQVGTLTVMGGTITGGDVAVEIRRGTLNISGGTFTSNSTTFVCMPNTSPTSGSTASGVAVAIAPHGAVGELGKEVKVNITGGTFNGIYGLYQADPDNRTEQGVNIDIDVSNGKFVSTGTYTQGDTVYGAAVYSKDVTNFISGGTFSTPVREYVIADLKYEATTNDGNYTYHSTLDNAVAAAGDNGHIDNISVDSNQGTLLVKYNDGTGREVRIYTSMVAPEVPTMTREGYTFKGWLIDEGTTVYADLSTIEFTNDGATLTAVWSANSYYYYPSTSDTTTSTTTKGSPKTFDAGVGIYAVTAVLSVTGMAWTAKKRH